MKQIAAMQASIEALTLQQQRISSQAPSGSFRGRGRGRGRGGSLPTSTTTTMGRGAGRGSGSAYNGRRFSTEEYNRLRALPMDQRDKWIFCGRCKQNGSHFTYECPHSMFEIQMMQPQEPRAPDSYPN